MKIKGKYSIKVANNAVWRNITNPEVLERTVPGIKNLERRW